MAVVTRAEELHDPVVVEIDDKRANAAGVSVARLIQILRDDNFAMSAGVIDEGEQRYPLRVLARVETVEELSHLPIGGGLELSDVATVELQRSGDDELYRISGSEGYILAIYKESTMNTVATATAIRTALDRVLDTADGRQIEIEIFFDQGEIIEGSLDNLVDTTLWGGLFAILILFAFLRRVRMTFISAAAICACAIRRHWPRWPRPCCADHPVSVLPTGLRARAAADNGLESGMKLHPTRPVAPADNDR